MPAVIEYPTPQIAPVAAPGGLVFDPGGAGLTFDAGFPLTFAPDQPSDLTALFPAFIPQPEQIVYDAVRDACNTRALFPHDGQGLALPAQFSLPPRIGLFAGMDSTYPPVNGRVEVAPIPVVRGWPAYPGEIPAIGVAYTNSTEDQAERAAQAGFAGDVFATDPYGNVLATCAYYAEPLHTTVVVELIHTNRDERDRLHDQLWRVIYPLRSLIPASSSQVKEVSVSDEKQDLPVDEQPTVMYVSVFTIEVSSETLLPTEIVPGGVITNLQTTVTPIELSFDWSPTDAQIDYT